MATKQPLNGYKHIEGNFLLNQNTIGKPVQSICIDWMHLLFQTGDWGRAAVQILILGTTARTFNAYDQLADYTRRFRFPRGMFAPTLFNATHWDSCKEATNPNALLLKVCRFTAFSTNSSRMCCCRSMQVLPRRHPCVQWSRITQIFAT